MRSNLSSVSVILTTFSSIFHRKGIFFNSLFKISEFLFQSSLQAGGQEEREAITHVHICD